MGMLAWVQYAFFHIWISGIKNNNNEEGHESKRNYTMSDVDRGEKGQEVKRGVKYYQHYYMHARKCHNELLALNNCYTLRKGGNLHVWVFNSILLINVSIMSIPCWFYYYSFVVQLEI